MPTYEYVCPDGHQFERFQRMTDRPRAKCPTCGKPGARKISGGAGLVFRGSGFYITDYGKDGKGPRKAESEKPAEKPAETKTESATADAKPAKSESKRSGGKAGKAAE